MSMTTRPVPRTPTGWTIGNQVVTTARLPNGQTLKGVLVHFQTGGGAASTVFVPDATYTPAKVRALVADKAATVDAVAQLSTPGTGPASRQGA